MTADPTSDDGRQTADAEFRRDVLRGLAASPRALPGKYLWDERGSRLFEEVTRSPGYYPASVETRLLADCAGELAQLVGPDATIVEFGSGATHKIALLLDALQAARRYIGIDISAAFTTEAVARLRSSYASVEVAYVEADFSRELPALPLDREHPVLGCLLGCAIGNMDSSEAVGLLARIRRALSDGFLLIGQDTTCEEPRLQAAYGSPEMAALHRNILSRLQFELGASLSPAHFRFEARVLDAPRRVEAHLVATEPTEIAVEERVFALRPGESIRTDVAVKYAPDAFAELAHSAGWTTTRRWSDPERLYGLHLLRSR